jgi:hypothetical protein
MRPFAANSETMPKKRTKITIRADDLVKEFDKVHDRAELIALLAPLHLPEGLSEGEKHRIANSLVRATARVWAKV